MREAGDVEGRAAMFGIYSFWNYWVLNFSKVLNIFVFYMPCPEATLGVGHERGKPASAFCVGFLSQSWRFSQKVAC